MEQDKLKDGKRRSYLVVKINDLAHARNKELRDLRKKCYKKFEWLLDQLDIKVKPTLR